MDKHRHKWPNRWGNNTEQPTVDCTVDPPLTRQEFRDEADINNLIKRMLNGQSVPMRQPQYGDADYTNDLQGAYEAAEKLVDTYNTLPEAVRDQVTKTEFVSRILKGEQLDAFTQTNTEETDTAKSAEPVKDTQN